MKKVKFILWLLIPFLASSCLQEGSETIVLSKVSPMDDIIPINVRFALEEQMPVYTGDNPPVVEGVYLISPTQLVFATDFDNTPSSFSNFTIEFSNQNTTKNTLEYREKQGNSSASSDDVYIIGDDDNFTAYFTASGTSSGIKVKMATVISGKKSSTGIKDFYYAFVMLEKGKDSDNELMDEGEFRVFTDGDGNAKNSDWNKSALFDNNQLVAFEKAMRVINKSSLNK